MPAYYKMNREDFIRHMKATEHSWGSRGGVKVNNINPVSFGQIQIRNRFDEVESVFPFTNKRRKVDGLRMAQAQAQVKHLKNYYLVYAFGI